MSNSTINLFANLRNVTCAAAVTISLVEKAENEWDLDESDITRDADQMGYRADWASAACRALGLRGRSSNDILSAFGNAMVELCETMAAIVGLRVELAPLADTYGLDASVNAAVLGLAR